MSLLKRFGAMALNWSKKLKGLTNRSSLRMALFLQPLVIILVAFSLIFISFNLALWQFIEGQTDSAIANQLQVMDNLYRGKSPSTTGRTSNILDTTYLILDETFEVTYLSSSMDDLSEKDISRSISDYYRQSGTWHGAHDLSEESADSDWWDEEFDDWDLDELNWSHLLPIKPHLNQVTIDDNSYVVDMVAYQGQLKDYYISKVVSDGQSSTYYLLIFADITPIREMETWINHILIALFFIIGLGASLFIFLTARKLDQAILWLKDDITRIGNGEDNLEPRRLPYRELNDVRATVDHMSRLIAANQKSQQVFFQNSSHELRTPLMSIQGYAEGIKEGVIKDNQAAATIIYQESQKMGELVDDILAMSQLEVIKDKLIKESISVPELLYDLTWRLKKQADDKGLVFYHDFEDEFLLIQADEKLLERALINLLSNALRYAKTAIWLESHQSGHELVVSISNDGPAISPEQEEHLFERFYKGKDGHFGIGLAMTKEILDRHQGRIWVQSNAEKTSFILALPLP